MLGGLANLVMNSEPLPLDVQWMSVLPYTTRTTGAAQPNLAGCALSGVGSVY